MIRIKIEKSNASLVDSEPILSSSRGVTQVFFAFSPDWEGLIKKAVFRCGNIERSVLLDETDICDIPAEVLEKHGKKLYIGAIGFSGERIIKPTVWCDAGFVAEGTADSAEATEPTPGIYEQILNIAASAEEKVDVLRHEAESGAFKGEKGDRGEKGDKGETGEAGAGIISASQTQTGHEDWELTLLYSDGGESRINVPYGSVTSVNGMAGNIALDSENIPCGEVTIGEAIRKKAESDGYYPLMAVGAADNLIDKKGVGEPQTFSFRSVYGGGSIEDNSLAEIISIRGNMLKAGDRLIPMRIKAIKTVGFNAFDGKNGMAEVVAADDSEGGNHGYRISGEYTSISFSPEEYGEYTELPVYTYTDNSGNTVNRVLPPENGFIKIAGHGENTCLNLIWSGYRDNGYEPYFESLRELPTAEYFPGGMNRANNAFDELRADKAIKRINSIDLGSITFALAIAAKPNTFLSTSSLSDAVHPAGQTQVANIATGAFESNSMRHVYSFAENGIALDQDGRIWITDTRFSTAQELNSYLRGKILYYELAEPIITYISPNLNFCYAVSDFGTEKAVSDSNSAPFSAVIKYSADYPRTVANIKNSFIPKNAPDAEGTYVLKCTSASGIKTYFWDREE